MVFYRDKSWSYGRHDRYSRGRVKSNQTPSLLGGETVNGIELRMTPERMREIRERMHLPVRSLARWIIRAESTLRAMEAGSRPIPGERALAVGWGRIANSV